MNYILYKIVNSLHSTERMNPQKYKMIKFSININKLRISKLEQKNENHNKTSVFLIASFTPTFAA